MIVVLAVLMREDFDKRLDTIAESIEMGRADDEVAALAAKRIRSGADRAHAGWRRPDAYCLATAKHASSAVSSSIKRS